MDIAIEYLVSATNIMAKLRSVLNVIFDSQHQSVKTKLLDMDLHTKINEIDAFFSDIQKINLKNTCIGSVTVSIRALHESVDKIHEILMEITKKADEHNSKILPSLRSFDATVQMDELIKHDSILDKRYIRLKQLLSIPWNNLK